jgi:hypothetical protein
MQVTAHNKITRENMVRDLLAYINWWKQVTPDYIEYDKEKSIIVFEAMVALENNQGKRNDYVDKVLSKLIDKWDEEELLLGLISMGMDDLEMIKGMRLMKLSEKEY